MALASGRLELMNASPHHAKIKATVHLAAPLFIAGEEILGKMEMECRADKGLGIGVIMVELFATQELTSRDHSATATFLTSRRLFQGPSLPPSNAVLAHLPPGAPALPQHYYQARKGNSTFFFRFPLPIPSPSSINFGNGLARVRYQVRASVGVSWKGEKRLVTDLKDAEVAECITEDPALMLPATVVGEAGKLWAQGRVVGGVAIAGQPACLELTLKNHTNKKTTGLSLTLTRKLVLQNVVPSKNPLQISDTLITENFKGVEYTVQPGVEGVANLVFEVPKHARGVRGGLREGGEEDEPRHSESLFEVKCVITIKIGMGLGSKDVTLEVPVTICHPKALPEPDPYAQLAAPAAAYTTPDPYMSPMPVPYPAPYSLELPHPYFAQGGMASGSGSSSPHHPSYTPPSGYIQAPYIPPHPALSPIPPFIQPGQHTSPPPGVYFPPPPPDQAYYFPPQPAYDMPPRPISAEPLLSQPLPGLPYSQSHGPFTNTQASPASPGEPEEGKGRRASRISTHLRLSSRNRSASPTSHRHPAIPPASASPPHQLFAISAATAPSTPTVPIAIPQQLKQPELLSPRPMLSPKASFSQDLAASGSPGKSGRVQALERYAAEVEAAQTRIPPKPEPELDAKDLAQILDKTLPYPPVPSGKAPNKIKPTSAAVPKVSDIFSPESGKDARRLSVVNEPEPSQQIPKPSTNFLSPGGLDALEKRLLAEVGTRKHVDIRQGLKKLDETVAQALASRSNPVAQTAKPEEVKVLAAISRSRPQESNELPSKEDKKLADRSSREQLSTGIPFSRRERRRVSMQTTQSSTESGPVLVLPKATPTTKGKPKPRPSVDQKEEEMHRLRKLAKGRVAAWLGGIDTTSVEVEQDLPLVSKPNASPDAKSPAKAQTETPTKDQVLSAAASASIILRNIPRASSGFVQTSKIIPASDVFAEQPRSRKNSTADPSKDIVELAKSSEPKVDPQTAKKPRRTPPPALAPLVVDLPKNLKRPLVIDPPRNPPPATSPSIPKLKPSPRLPTYPPTAPSVSPEQPKYDYRSARGGKGGVVTSVAALWANVAAKNEGGAPAPVNGKLKLVVGTKRPVGLNVGRAKPTTHPPTTGNPLSPSLDAIPEGSAQVQPPARSTSISSAAAAAPPLTTDKVAAATASPSSAASTTTTSSTPSAPPPLFKSTSVPARLSSSLATPTLSSTASLARPIGDGLKRRVINVPPTISESKSEPVKLGAAADLKRPLVKEDVGKEVGQAKLAAVKPPNEGGGGVVVGVGQAKLKDLIRKYQQ